MITRLELSWWLDRLMTSCTSTRLIESMFVIGFSWPSTVPCWRARYSSSNATSTGSAPMAAAFIRNWGVGGNRIRNPARSSGVRIGTFAVNWRAPVFHAPRMWTPVASSKPCFSSSEAGSVKNRYMWSLSSNTNAPSTALIGS